MTGWGSRQGRWFATRCKFPAGVVDGMSWPGGLAHHTWLRVRIGEEELDVCPGSVNNRPGATHFEILSKVRTYEPWMRWLMYVPSSIVNIRRDRMARRGLTGAAKKRVLAGENR
jgi:hypothetical protein